MSENNIKTDIMLLQEIKSDKAGAIDELIKRYIPLVEIIAVKYLDSPLEKDDLVQEGLRGLLSAIKSYDESKGASFKTYASICVRHSIQDALKKFSRSKDIPQDYIVELTDDLDDVLSTLSAEDEFLAKESVSNLVEILYDGLSRFEKSVLMLRIDGKTYDEIAKILGKTPKAIDNAIQRIRKKLNGVTF